MGLTERHWFEDEEPELTEQQLEDIVYENKKAYDNGYIKGFHDAKIEFLTPEKAEQLLKEHPQIVRCKYCILRFTTKCALHDQAFPINKGDNWFCADGKRR